MIRPLILAGLVAAAPFTATAQGVFIPPPGATNGAELKGLRGHVARQLPRYGFGGVDVGRLSSGQVATINSLIHSGRSEGDIGSLIGGVLRPGVLTRTLNRF